MKLVTVLKRRPDMTRDEFVDRWLTKHAPMAAVFPGLQSYTLSGVEGPETTADAFAELEFASREACQAAYSSDVGRAGSGDANAYTTRRAQALIDQQDLGGPSERGPNKVVICAKRDARTERADFVAWWLDEVASAAQASLPGQSLRICVDGEGLLLNSDPDSPAGLQEGEGVLDGLLEVWLRPQQDPAELDAGLQPVLDLCEAHGCTVERLVLRVNKIV